MCIVVAKGALPNESGTHDDAAAAARPVARSEGLVCVFAKTIYNTRKVSVVLYCFASRRVVLALALTTFGTRCHPRSLNDRPSRCRIWRPPFAFFVWSAQI